VTECQKKQIIFLTFSKKEYIVKRTLLIYFLKQFFSYSVLSMKIFFVTETTSIVLTVVLTSNGQNLIKQKQQHLRHSNFSFLQRFSSLWYDIDTKKLFVVSKEIGFLY